MSHELRTPLNAVIGFSDVLLDQMFGPLNEKQDEYVRDIGNAGRHLLELINEILDLSKVEAGQMELELDDVSVAGLLDGGVAMVRERAGREGIALHARRLARCRNRPRRRAQDQAGDPEPAHQRREVHSRRRHGGHDGARASATRRESASSTRAWVSPTPTSERIFEAFQRGGRTARTSTEGTGLGLTLSQADHRPARGPTVDGEPRSGVGSTFSFAIPLASAGNSPSPTLRWATRTRAGRRAAPAPCSSWRTTGARPICSRSTSRAPGYAVAVARDGVEGLELARRLAAAGGHARHPAARD